MIRLLACAVLLIAPISFAQSKCPSQPAMRLRIMTYNAWFQVTPGDSAEAFGMSHAERASMVAKRIIKDDPDIVALQELNSDDAKWAMIEVLQTKYPSYIRKIDQNNLLNDSGLMLFSKFPFANPDSVTIDRTFLGSNEDTCVGMNGPNEVVKNCNQLIYSANNGDDWWANKGVGLVRVVNSCNRREPFNIAFTHAQSKGSSDDSDCYYGEDVRDLQAQLSQVRQLFESSFTTASLKSQPTFFVGDFNLDGNQVGANVVTSRDRKYVLTLDTPWHPGNPTGQQNACTYTKSSKFNEWQLTFDSATHGITDDVNRSFYACRGNRMATGCSYTGPGKGTFFVDSWASNTSARDPGQTSAGETGMSGKPTDPDEGGRLDYVLHNEPRDPASNQRTMCTQWVRRGFRGGSGDEMSDHLGVTADFNFPAPRCTVRPRQPNDPALEKGDQADPLGPERVHFPDGVNDVEFVGQNEGATPTTAIRHPGSMQWYVIDQHVPVEITATGLAAFEVFQATDLSSPVREGLDCTPMRRGQKCKLTLSSPPYYVRVFGAHENDPTREDRDVTGPYSISFHRLTCASRAEACRLMPAVPFTAHWPDTLANPGAGTDELWFELETEFSKNGGQPHVDFEAIHTFPVRTAGGYYVDPLAPSIVNKKQLVLNGGGPGGFGSQAPPPANNSTTPTWEALGGGKFRRILTARSSTLPGQLGWPEKYYVVFKRDLAHVQDEAELTVTLRTSLSYFRPKLLRCDLERTYVGHDDIASSFRYGAVQDAMRMLGAVAGDYETWYRGSRMWEAGTPNPGRTNLPYQLDWSIVGDGPGNGEGIRARMYEDVLDGDNYLFCSPGGTCWPVYSDAPPIAAKKRSEPDPSGPDETSRYRYTDSVADPYYDYSMFYRVTHTRPMCRGTTGAGLSDCGANMTCSAAVSGLSAYNLSPRCVCTSNAGCRPGETCDVATGVCQ